MMDPVEVIRGDGPVILAMPHTGVFVPAAIFDRLNERGKLLIDTDWHIDRLYQSVLKTASIVRATFHRYVIDPNRDPGGESLYPGQNTTGLCPVTDFDGNPIYYPGEEPHSEELAERTRDFHAAYHLALAAEIKRVRAMFGRVVLYDCHSIRSRIPHLFDGELPDFNIGTNCGQSCAPELEAYVREVCGNAMHYTSVLNGRFKGGWTTRHYGKPEQGVHAIQMELAQRTYMEEEPPWKFDDSEANQLRANLCLILEGLERWGRSGSTSQA